MTKHDMASNSNGWRLTAGLTLLELLITMAVVAILVAVAAPSFESVIMKNRIEGYRNSLAGSLKMARGQAVHSQTTVIMCASADQSGCGGTWVDGWIVFSDVDGSGARSIGSEPLTDVSYGDDRVRVTGGLTTVTFMSTGIRNGGGAAVLSVCHPDTSSPIVGKAVSISPTGSVSFSNAANC